LSAILRNQYLSCYPTATFVGTHLAYLHAAFCFSVPFKCFFPSCLVIANIGTAFLDSFNGENSELDGSIIDEALAS
jgi:hypothetical protein